MGLIVKRGVYVSQAKGCWLYVQIGMTGFFLQGKGGGPCLFRVEVLTPYRRFRVLWRGK
jgi:hypothetical protein